MRGAYSEPHLRYPDPDSYEQEYGPRSHYDDDDFRNGRQGFNEDTLERQRPGYKPSGNIVKYVQVVLSHIPAILKSGSSEGNMIR